MIIDLIKLVLKSGINVGVDLVLKNGCTLPPYCMYFRADYHFDWDGYKPYTQIDCTCFGYFVTDKNN